MQTVFILNDAGDTKIAQHNLFMLYVAEKVVARLDILMDDVVVVTIGQCCSTLQGNAAELVEVAVEVVFSERTTTKVLHQFVVTILTVHIGFSVVGNLDDHLEVEVLDNTHQLLLDGEIWIVYFQHALALFAFYQEHLRLAGVVTQALDATIYSALQHEVAIA